MKEIIGLDIGSHSIKLVGLKMTSKGPFLTALGMKEIPRRKEEEDIPVLIETLRALLKEISLTTKQVRLTVCGKGVTLLRLTFPSMPRAELLKAIDWETKDKLPFPIETAHTDFYILDEFTEEGVKKLDLMVIACPKPLIDRTLSIAGGAGLQTSHLDIAPFALWNAFILNGQSGKEEVVALIDLGREETGIHLFKNGILQFSREITPAGEDITQAIMEGLGHEENPDLLYEQAEEIKQTVGIRLEDGAGTPGEILRPLEKTTSRDESQGKPVPHLVSFWMRPVLERLAAEIGRSLDYYRAQFNVVRVDRVLLTGGGANLKNIAAFLSRELHLSVEVFNPLREILFDAKKIDAQVLDQKGIHFTVALGLALPEPKRIELLPVRETLWSKVRLRGRISILISLIILFGFLGIIWKMNGQVTTLQKELDVKMAMVKNLETLKTKLIFLKEKEGMIKQDLSLLPSSASVSIPYEDILREVSQLLPNNTTLTLFAIQSKGKPFQKGSQPPKTQEGEPIRDAEKELHLAGLAFGNDLQCLMALAQIIEGLEKSVFFKNARLMSADENKQFNRPGTEFEVASDFNHGGQKKGERE